MTYSFFAEAQKTTPQTQPIPGRSEMIQGKSGGYGFDVGIWQTVRRCLILGTAGDQHYSSKMELTGQFVEVLKQAIGQDPRKVADEILYASDGHAVNNHAPIFALVLLSMGDSSEAKTAFCDIFDRVIRTGSHFHEWMAYTKQLRGLGRIVEFVAKRWLTRDDVNWLTYQMLKYQQRNGFSFRDELRLFKPKAEGDLGLLFKAIVGKTNPTDHGISDPPHPLSQLWAYEWLKSNPDQGVAAVRNFGLTHEMVAPICTMSKDVWQALFEKMPIGALLRNLASLTEIGVLRFDEPANLDLVERKLTDRDLLRKGRIHPIDVL
jgi:60 kDa SS-A/Ro ribonucleoprotein